MRLATPSSLPAILALTESAYAPYIPILGAPPVPLTENYLPRIERGEIWLLDHDGKTVGLIVLERHATHAEIFSVAVDPAMHGKGFGRALLDFAVARTREWSLPELRLYTNAKMEKDIAIYQRYGFRETGRRQNPKRPEFTIVDMALSV
jgi:ribosomal protein S18 acetylase RimI-like enzyme